MPRDPIPGPSGPPLVAGTLPPFYPSYSTEFLPQSLPQVQRQAEYAWWPMLRRAPLPATFCLSFPKVFFFFLI